MPKDVVLTVYCMNCVQNSGYVRVSVPGQFARYEKCTECDGRGYQRIEILSLPVDVAMHVAELYGPDVINGRANDESDAEVTQ